jgi:hypothetical protein
MKNLFKILFLLILSKSVFAQLKTNAYKVNFSGADKRIVIMSANMGLDIVGTTGNEVIIEALEDKRELPAEADGLKIVSPGGGIDNTGVGANVIVEGTSMKIKIPKSKYYGNYIIKIPKDVSISLRENGNAYGKWLISDMKGEVEAQTSYSTLTINNVSGPIVARGGYGKIYVVYDQLNQSKPNSISASGAVDITLPADTKANLNIKATYADLFTDFDIQPMKKVAKTETNANINVSTSKEGQTLVTKDGIVYDRWGQKVENGTKGEKGEKGEKGDKDFPAVATAKSPNYVVSEDIARKKAWTLAGSNQNSDDCDCSNANETTGTINGGGVSLTIRSDHGNIFLRKKK